MTIERIPFGRTGHESSRLLFGAAALGRVDQGTADRTLEVLLQHYVYGRPLELKRDHHIRDAVLLILDCLVESGSSAAFRMRDDFVTPAA